jgi:hypothetical protein
MIITFSGQWIPIEIAFHALENKNSNRNIFLKLFGHKMRKTDIFHDPKIDRYFGVRFSVYFGFYRFEELIAFRSMFSLNMLVF